MSSAHPDVPAEQTLPDVPEEHKVRTYKQVANLLEMHPYTVKRKAERGEFWIFDGSRALPVIEEDHRGPYAVLPRLKLWMQKHHKAVGAPNLRLAS